MILVGGFFVVCLFGVFFFFVFFVFSGGFLYSFVLSDISSFVGKCLTQMKTSNKEKSLKTANGQIFQKALGGFRL